MWMTFFFNVSTLTHNWNNFISKFLVEPFRIATPRCFPRIRILEENTWLVQSFCNGQTLVQTSQCQHQIWNTTLLRPCARDTQSRRAAPRLQESAGLPFNDDKHVSDCVIGPYHQSPSTRCCTSKFVEHTTVYQLGRPSPRKWYGRKR